MVVVVQALLLTLGYLMLSGLGATYVASVGGLLSAAWRAPFAPFTVIFAMMFGLLVDGFSHAFKVKSSEGDVRTGRLVASVTASTALVGMASYYVTVYMLNLLPRNVILEVSILAAGIINGVAAGYLAGLIWRKYLRTFLIG